MPVEIRELVIKVAVLAPLPQTAADPKKGGDARELLIEDCVDAVLDILRERNER
jgi:hypothetical protein